VTVGLGDWSVSSLSSPCPDFLTFPLLLPFSKMPFCWLVRCSSCPKFPLFYVYLPPVPPSEAELPPHHTTAALVQMYHPKILLPFPSFNPIPYASDAHRQTLFSPRCCPPQSFPPGLCLSRLRWFLLLFQLALVNFSLNPKGGHSFFSH